MQGTVLVVDDSAMMRKVVLRVLKMADVEFESTLEAGDGNEALEMLRRGADFDFMLLDVNMPGMSGLECVKTLRDAGLQTPMKVMMVTTEDDHSFIRRALEYGADEFLMKPFTPESLREKLSMLGVGA